MSGGGEDVDFCLRQQKWPLLPVPEAVVHYPWWRNGARDYSRFSGWALGDGRMLDLHPRYVYWRYPNLVEVLLGILLYLAGWTLVCGPIVVAVIQLLPLLVTLCMAELGVEIHRCFIGADRWALQKRLVF